MSLRKKILLGLAALALLALGSAVLWVGSQFSRHEKEVTYPSPEVLFKPYLAAEHFLQKQGIKFRYSTRLNKAMRTPAAGQTLLLLANRHSMSESQSEQLLQWAGDGGHLVVIAERLWNEKKAKSGDLLLDRLGIEQHLAKDFRANKANKKNTDPYSRLTKLYLENERSPAYISFDTRYHLYDAQQRAHAWANSGDDITHILQLHYGDGLITVLTDAFIWKNNNIGDYDNAWLLWYLAQDSEVTLLDTLIQRLNSPNLFDALLNYFPEALASLLLLILLALWHQGQRQGALLPAASRARRQLQEHLRASADFLLRRMGKAHLIQMLQQDIEQRAGQRHPSFAALDEDKRQAMLAQLSRLPKSQIQQAMQAAPKHLSAADFSRQVKQLQTLRNAL